MFLTLLISIVLFIVLFTFQILTFNTFFIFGLTAAILIAVSNNLSILLRIKEKLKNKKTEELTKVELTKISNGVVRDSFKRMIISNGILMSILLIFTLLPGGQSILFTIPLMIFILMSLVVSMVMAPYFFNIFKAFKSRRKREKILNNY
jgi:preprotein translocase subunit SecF